jgi:DNA-directed RNA polymerase sigma subunit (sigma70/sigma32)
MIFFSISSVPPQSSRSRAPIDELISREEQTMIDQDKANCDKALGKLTPRLREALLAQFDLHPEGRDVRSLASVWGVTRTRIYQLAAKARQRVARELRNQIRAEAKNVH